MSPNDLLSSNLIWASPHEGLEYNDEMLEGGAAKPLPKKLDETP